MGMNPDASRGRPTAAPTGSLTTTTYLGEISPTTEARLRIEAGSAVLAAALLDPSAIPLTLAAEHALVMNEIAVRWLAVAA